MTFKCTKELDLSDKQLSRISSQVLKCDNDIEKLNLGHNNFNILDKDIKKLVNLVTLNL